MQDAPRRIVVDYIPSIVTETVQLDTNSSVPLKFMKKQDNDMVNPICGTRYVLL